jgi:hypothetical protein
MNEDRLLGELGDLARRQDEAEQTGLDERWDRLTAGTLTAQEEAELKALAESSPEIRETYEAFRPLGAGFQARMVAAAQAGLASDGPRAETPEPPPRPLPFPRAAARIEVWLGTAAALAAGLFFLVRGLAPLPPLPGYVAELSVDSREFRGGEPSPASGTPVAAPGAPLTVRILPDTAVAGEVEAQGFLATAQGDDFRPWPPASGIMVHEKGVVTLSGPLDKDLRPGPWTIWVVVARPGKLPGDLPAELRAGRTGKADWQAVSRRLEVRPSP